MISHSPLTQQSPVTVQDKNAFYFDSRQHDARATTNVNEKNLEALFPPSGNLNNGTFKLHEIKAKHKKWPRNIFLLLLQGIRIHLKTTRERCHHLPKYHLPLHLNPAKFFRKYPILVTHRHPNIRQSLHYRRNCPFRRGLTRRLRRR